MQAILAVSVRLVFWPILGYCKLELMLLSFSSGWQLRQREMFICLEFYIDMYWRNAEWSQSRPTLYGCLVRAYVTFFPFLLHLLAGEKGKSKELLWPESVFSLNLLHVYCSVAYFLLVLLLSNCEPNLCVFWALLYVNLISKLKANNFLQQYIHFLRSAFGFWVQNHCCFSQSSCQKKILSIITLQ